MLVDLILLEFQDFDAILGMDWLFAYNASVDCFRKTVTFSPLDQPPFKFIGIQEKFPSIISALSATQLLLKGCQGYLTFISGEESKKPVLKDIPIVRDFLDVFPKDLLALPPNRQIEFTINLLPSTAPISKPPYRMTPIELEELKK